MTGSFFDSRFARERAPLLSEVIAFAKKNDTEESINRMIDLNVDHIITDDITLAKECIYLSKTSDVVSEYVKWLSK